MALRLNVFRRRPRPTAPPVASTVDAERLAHVLLFITEHERQHDQTSWLYSAFANRDARHFETVTIESTLGFASSVVCPPGESVRVLRPEHAWDCETSACLAGWTALLAEWRPVDRTGLVYRDGRVGTVSTVATELLGLSFDQEDALFYGGNSLERLWELADEYTNGEVGRIAARLTAERELAEAAARVGDAPVEPTPFAPIAAELTELHDELTSS